MVLRHLTSYALTLLLAIVIAYFSLSPPTGGQAPFPHFDKLIHLLAFACLAFPVSIAGTQPHHRVFLAGLAYGALIEIVQPLVGRTGDWADLLADAVGLGLGIGLAILIRRGMRALKT